MEVVRSVSQPYELVHAGTDTPNVTLGTEFWLVICYFIVYEVVLVVLRFILLDVRWEFLFLYEKSARTHLVRCRLGNSYGRSVSHCPEPLELRRIPGVIVPCGMRNAEVT